MKRKETIVDFAGQVLMIYGFAVLCLNLLCVLFGESVREFSTIFELGSAGLTKNTSFQVFMMAVIIVAMKFLFFTDMVITQASVRVRTAGMYVTVILMLALFVVKCGWFPVNMWQPWVLFFLCFGGSAAGSILLSAMKEKTENRQMAEVLERLKSVKLESGGRESAVQGQRGRTAVQGGESDRAAIRAKRISERKRSEGREVSEAEKASGEE